MLSLQKPKRSVNKGDKLLKKLKHSLRRRANARNVNLFFTVAQLIILNDPTILNSPFAVVHCDKQYFPENKNELLNGLF